MRPRNFLLNTALATALTVGAGAATLAPPASAAPGDLAGTWTSIDLDGSSQQLTVNGSGSHRYSMFLYDDEATSACDGNPARLTGTGELDGDTLTMTGSLTCLPGGNALRFRIDYVFVYSAGSDTLTDDAGVVWYRA